MSKAFSPPADLIDGSHDPGVIAEDDADKAPGMDPVADEDDAEGNVFVFGDGFDHELILDFEPSVDVLKLYSATVGDWDAFEARLDADEDGNALLTLDDGSTLMLVGVPPKALGPDQVILTGRPICFAAGTLIATPDGPVPVERLRPGDLVLTCDGPPLPVLWTWAQKLVLQGESARCRPLVLAPGALGPGLPAAPLRLSPGHGVLVHGPLGWKSHARGVLTAAGNLRGRPGVVGDTTTSTVRYHHFLLPRHALVLANGLPCESFYPGPAGLEGLAPATRHRIEALLPGVTDDPHAVYGKTARPVIGLARALTLSPAEARCPARHMAQEVPA